MTPVRSLADAVVHRAERDPDGELVRLAGHEGWSASRLLARAEAAAAGLADFVGAGDLVATATASGPEAVAITTALSLLGVVELPIPSSLEPSAAARLCTAARCVLVITDAERLSVEPHLATLGSHPTARLVVSDGVVTGYPSVDDLATTSRWSRNHRSACDEPAAIMVTSGTSGRPKGAILPNGAALGQADRVRRAMEYGADDVLLNVFPWQHINARHASFLPAVLSGARMVIEPRFSASRFWQTAVEEQVTAFNFMGAMCALLVRQPGGSADRSHSVDRAYGGPAPAWLWHEMRDRFGVVLRQAYACTELGDVATTGHDVRPGAAGRPVREYDVRVTSDRGLPVPEGEVGELSARPAQPGLTFLGYVGDPEATAAAWDDGWFRTGDRVRIVDGWLYHEGRGADVIRRRGLSLDAEHIERVVLEFAGVAEAAAVGVPSELTDDEVLVVVIAREGGPIDITALHHHCVERLPRQAVPRFFSVEPSLPRNVNLKLLRVSLRDRGLPSRIWEAESAAPPTKEIS